MANPTALRSLESEMAVIGGLFLDPGRFAEVAEIVSHDDFSTPHHRLIFSCMAALAKAGQPVDLVTTAEWLETHGQLEDAGGFAYLGVMARDTPSAANVTAYARLVRNYARRRALLNLSHQLGQWTLAEPDVEAVLSRLDRELRAMDAATPTTGPRLLGDWLPDVLTQLEDRSQRRPGTRLGLSMGLGDVDDKLDGFCPGRLYVVAGRPGHGKSVFGLQAARGAVAAGRDALLFSLEMPGHEIVHRLLAAEHPMDYALLQSARMSAPDWLGLTETAARLAPARLWIDDSSSLTLAELLTRARRLHRKRPLGMIVVDYLGLVTGERSDRRDLEVGSISRALKSLAKELELPVLLLAQLNRELERRPNKRPMLADLRESGAVEQDADVVLFVYRDELYNPDTLDKGCAELIVGKQRAGTTGTIPLVFRGEHCTFLPLAGPLPSQKQFSVDARPAPRRRGIDL